MSKFAASFRSADASSSSAFAGTSGNISERETDGSGMERLQHGCSSFVLDPREKL